MVLLALGMRECDPWQWFILASKPLGLLADSCRKLQKAVFWPRNSPVALSLPSGDTVISFL